jgi:hypothetical protein
MPRELTPRSRDEIDMAFPPRPVSWRTQYLEEDAAYKLEARMESVRRITERAIDTIVDTHEHISARAGHDPALEHQLRRIEETVSFCAAELIARYMGRS